MRRSLSSSSGLLALAVAARERFAATVIGQTSSTRAMCGGGTGLSFVQAARRADSTSCPRAAA